MKKLLSILLALTLVLALGVTAFADETPTTKGSITIYNASKGVTYKVYKLFDATMNADEDGISYTATADQKEFYEGKDGNPFVFTANSAGSYYVTVKDGANVTTFLQGFYDEETKALNTEFVAKVAKLVDSKPGDGNSVEFTGLGYGYYYITSSLGSVVTIDSTDPDAGVYDKNESEPVKDLTKTAKDGESYNIGDTITYTVSFKTANYNGAGDAARQIVSYTIEDDLPGFLKENSVIVTSITIGGSEYTVDGDTPQFDDEGEITILWTDGNGKSLYAAGAEIVITYTAVLDSDAAIAGDGNTNNVTITFKDEDGKKTTTDEESATVYTYALAVIKVDNKGNKLQGAQFSLNGYQTDGSNGVYTVTGTTTDGKTDTVMDTDSEGILIIKGVKGDTEYYLTETKAPDGYNKLTSATPVTAEETSVTTTNVIKYIDENGDVTDTVTKVVVSYTNSDLSATPVVVVNNTGSVLPSTGGIGTTIFTVVGIVLMAGAAVLLITKKRMEGKDAK